MSFLLVVFLLVVFFLVVALAGCLLDDCLLAANPRVTTTTVPKSKGDPKILKRGPNFEQEGDPKLDFSEMFTKSKYVKIVKKPN